MTTTELKNQIGAAAAVVTFTKKNGEKRVMKCAINQGFLRTVPDFIAPTKTAVFDAESRGMVRVWDLENGNWRTITAETVETVETVEVQ